MHIKCADQPIPHAHIALNMWHLHEVLGDVDALSKAIALAIVMLKDEVLARMS